VQAATPDEAARVEAPVELPVEMADGPAVTDVVAEPASVHVIVMGDRTRIVVSGEIDADLSADLQEATSDAEATGLPIEVDAQHVTFMDSSGIAFLARLASRSTERVRILRAPDTVRFLLEVTRIGELLDLVDEPAGGPADAGTATPVHGLPTIPRPTPPDVVA
jgi:anti-anti-sigma factor